MEIVEFGPLTPELRAELEGDELDPFDAAGETLQYRRKEQHVALRDDVGRLIASTGMLVVEVEVGGERFPVAGIGGVIVNAGYRSRGFARTVVEAAVVKARTLGPAFAILFCHADRAGLYRRLEFTEVTSEVLVEQPGGYAPMPQQTMWRALRAGAAWPDGPATLHSLPF